MSPRGAHSPRRIPACDFPASPPEGLFGEHSEPRGGNVPLTRTPNTTREDAHAPEKFRGRQRFGDFLREPLYGAGGS